MIRKTHGTPTWIWSVAVDGSLYVRAYNGQDSRWYQSPIRQKAGRIIASAVIDGDARSATIRITPKAGDA